MPHSGTESERRTWFFNGTCRGAAHDCSVVDEADPIDLDEGQGVS